MPSLNHIAGQTGSKLFARNYLQQRPQINSLTALALAGMPRSSVTRRRIFEFIRGSGDDPFHRGHYVEADSLGRPNEVEIINDYAITYWADPAVKEVKVLDIQPAD